MDRLLADWSPFSQPAITETTVPWVLSVILSSSFELELAARYSHRFPGRRSLARR